jgi:outer membrane protein
MRTKLALATLALLLALLLFPSFIAQEQATRVVYLNSEAVIEAHPISAELRQLQEQAAAELTPLRDEIEALQRRALAGETLTVDERNQYELLVQSYEAASQSLARELEETSQPALEAINEVVAQLSRERGYAIVLDGGVAQRVGLIVYAGPDLDITQEVIERLP